VGKAQWRPGRPGGSSTGDRGNLSEGLGIARQVKIGAGVRPEMQAGEIGDERTHGNVQLATLAHDTQRRCDPGIRGNHHIGLLGVDQRAQTGAAGAVEHSQRDLTPQLPAHADRIRERICRRPMRELPACEALEEDPQWTP
jgi:hypothetical protein